MAYNISCPDGVVFTSITDVGSFVTSGLDVTGVITATSNLAIGGEITTGPGWKDILSDIIVKGLGPSDPTWSQINSTNHWGYKFVINDTAWVFYHIGHDYKPGSEIYLHAHWLPDGTNSNSVRWQWIYAIAKGHNQSAFPLASPTTITATQTVGGTQYQHYITETVPIASAQLEPDAIIAVQISRITNGGTDNTDGIFLLFADVHYQADRSSTLNRSPNFYA